MHDFTFERSPFKCFFVCAIIFNAHLFAASYPSSTLKFLPSFPFIKLPSLSIEICPDIKRNFPTSFVATYEPTGAAALGKSIFNSLTYCLT